MKKKVVPKLQQEVKVKIDIVTSGTATRENVTDGVHSMK